MDLAKLETLKQLLLDAEKFWDIWDYFMTHFGENEAFMALGEPTRSPHLEASIEMAAAELVGRKLQMGKQVTVGRRVLIAIPGQPFIHGAVQLNGHMGNVLYFEDVGVGLLAVSLNDGQGRFARFTVADQKKGALARN